MARNAESERGAELVLIMHGWFRHGQHRTLGSFGNLEIRCDKLTL